MSNLGNAQDLGFKSRNYSKTPSFHAEPGDTFGEWTIITKLTHDTYRAKCSCGVVTTIRAHALKYNKTKMCSMCSMKKRRQERQKKHALVFDGIIK